MGAFEIGVFVPLTDDAAGFKKVRELELTTCQLGCWTPEIYSESLAKKVIQASNEHRVHIAALWAGWTGPKTWDFLDGPATLGIVPAEFRSQRVEELKKGAEFAAMIKAPAIITHLGFLPENPKDPIYEPIVETVRQIAEFCRERDLGFWFETGQETPVTLLRLIEDVGMDNLGINFDTANLILYGKANSVDAMTVFGKYVRNVHAKDGLYPTGGRSLGSEVRLGDGKADIPGILKCLKEFGFEGELIIEREVAGDKQIGDIKYAKKYLENALKRAGISAAI